MESSGKLLQATTSYGYGTVPAVDKQRSEDATDRTGCCRLRMRLLLYVMIFLAGTISYANRVSLSQALVAMVNRTSYNASSDTDQLCPRDPHPNTTSDDVMRGGEFDWDRHAQGAVLAAFYYGYALIQVCRSTVIANNSFCKSVCNLKSQNR